MGPHERDLGEGTESTRTRPTRTSSSSTSGPQSADVSPDGAEHIRVVIRTRAETDGRWGIPRFYLAKIAGRTLVLAAGQRDLLDFLASDPVLTVAPIRRAVARREG